MTPFALALALLGSLAPDPLPTLVLTTDNTLVAASCIIRIPPGTVLEDADGNGILHVTSDNLTITFEPGSVLRGSAPGSDPDLAKGTAIRISGRSGVSIEGLPAEGFHVGIWATAAPNLTINRCTFDHMWRPRLASTPEAEAAADWLWPHNNDHAEWRTRYGAAICIEQSTAPTIRSCRARAGQNGLILDRVSAARVYDNDFSFLSGWGIALWRSSHNTISRNALDFCIRGYSHGIYNRGQDSAGILLFEQCHHNTIAENSATHGGDGYFAFAGKQALGETPSPGFDHTRAGCNDNTVARNDFSYAAAHGLEHTFSFGNRFEGNRLVENAICGIWAGYAQSSLILNNTIKGNGPRTSRAGGGGGGG
ncbi:MAG: right-handed parallel beta-helix repeat-containing protein, partial [Phycisphaerales bacterium]